MLLKHGKQLLALRMEFGESYLDSEMSLSRGLNNKGFLQVDDVAYGFISFFMSHETSNYCGKYSALFEENFFRCFLSVCLGGSSQVELNRKYIFFG